MPGRYLKGAIVEFVQTFTAPVPNVIVFQFNPETMTHTWTQPIAAPANESAGNPLAVKGSPGETFQFTIVMDANDMIADGTPEAQDQATKTGIYSRLAALEMLQYPIDPASANNLLGTPSAGAKDSKVSVPLGQIPTVLFVWGSGRILPVRVTTLTITERIYDPLLNPTHAEAVLGLRVLPPEELVYLKGRQGEIATAAYSHTMSLRKQLAAANLDNDSQSILGMLPVR